MVWRRRRSHSADANSVVGALGREHSVVMSSLLDEFVARGVVRHIDGGFDAPPSPPPMIRMFSCFDSLSPESGGTLLLEGSHHVVERYMAENPTPIPGNSVSWGKFMRHRPALCCTHTGAPNVSDRPRQMLSTTAKPA